MKSHWFRLFAIVGIGLCGATADAANLKIYPGAVCQQSSNDGQRVLDRGSVRNQAPGFEVTVLCPFVRDESAGVSSAVVRVFDRNPNVAVTCTLHIESIINGSQFWSS